MNVARMILCSTSTVIVGVPRSSQVSPAMNVVLVSKVTLRRSSRYRASATTGAIAPRSHDGMWLTESGLGFQARPKRFAASGNASGWGPWIT